ncbi:MAG: type II toxin-antitoxin system VapC family toxin [Candidatus Binatia bacterium]
MSFFDTSFIIDLLREQRRGIDGGSHKKLRQLDETPVQLSCFVVCELEAGAALHHGQEEHQRVRRVCEQFEIVYPDERFASVYGATLAELKRQRITVATMELLIGVQALVENDTLITRNLRHFQKIPNLRVEDY